MQLIIRTWTMVSGLASQFVSYFERRNPDALLEVEKEKLRTLVSRFNEGLLSHAIVVERLRSRVRRGERDAAALGARIRALSAAGDPNAAGRVALRLKELTADTHEARIELEAADKAYGQLLQSRDQTVRDARDRIERLRWQIGDLKVKRAMADLEGLATAMVGGLGSPGESLNRLEEMVGEEREKATGRSRLAMPAEMPDALDSPTRTILEQDALREFLEQSASPTLELTAERTAPARIETKPTRTK